MSNKCEPSYKGMFFALGLIIVIAVALGTTIASNKNDQGPSWCYKHGVEIGSARAIYKDNSGKWQTFDTWMYVTRPTKGPDNNWHMIDHFTRDPQNVTVPGEMIINYTPDKVN